MARPIARRSPSRFPSGDAAPIDDQQEKAMARSHVRIPKEVKADQIIEVKTLFSHPMETGLRKTPDGLNIPRKIINRFECIYLGQTVFCRRAATGGIC
jgi:Sulphur oxidation protein SoxZ